MSLEVTRPWPTMTSRDEFRFLADLVLARSAGDDTVVTLLDRHSGTTRFANNQVIQNVDTRRAVMTVSVAFSGRHGTAATTDFSAGSIHDTLARATRLAKVSPVDPEFLTAPEPHMFADRETARPETMAAGPTRRLEYTNEAIGQCRMENLMAAGIVQSSVSAAGIAAGNGLFGYETRTDARFSLTVQAGQATGWSAAAHRSIDHLKIQERTLSAIAKAKQGHDPSELPPGRYPVILEPAAAAGLWVWLLRALDAKAYDKGTSPVAGRLGQYVLDRRVTVQNVPGHADLLGEGFTSDGLPSESSVWIERGVLKQLAYDRFTANAHGVKMIPTLDAPMVSVEGPAAGALPDLIKRTDRAILVTNLWYIRPVNPADLTLTGMTRDGTYLVENGTIVSAVKNLRFHESPLRVFREIEGWTEPMEAVSSETGKMLVPAMLLPQFNFSSGTRF